MIFSDGIHIVSDDSLQELHDFCHRIGIKSCWFHKGSKHPHYDIPKKMREHFFEATRLTKVSPREIVLASKRLKEEKK